MRTKKAFLVKLRGGERTKPIEGSIWKGRLGSFTQEHVETMSRSLTTFRRVWREWKKIYGRKVSLDSCCRLRCSRQFAINERLHGSQDIKIINRTDYSAKMFTSQLKGSSTSSVSRFDESESRESPRVLYLLSASLAQRVLSALRPHTQSHHECFPSRFAVLFLLQEIFLLSVLFCLLAIRTDTQNIFW